MTPHSYTPGRTGAEAVLTPPRLAGVGLGIIEVPGSDIIHEGGSKRALQKQHRLVRGKFARLRNAHSGQKRRSDFHRDPEKRPINGFSCFRRGFRIGRTPDFRKIPRAPLGPWVEKDRQNASQPATAGYWVEKDRQTSDLPPQVRRPGHQPAQANRRARPAQLYTTLCER